mgnify:CR=1 FL=1
MSRLLLKLLLLPIALLLSGSTFPSQSEAGSDAHIYKGRYSNYSDIIYTWDGEHLYKGRYANYSDIIYTWDGKHLYKGRYTNYSDIILTYDGKHLYRGRYTNYSDILLTLDAPIPAPILLLLVM